MDLIKLNNVLWKGDKITVFVRKDNIASFYEKDGKTLVHTVNDERYVLDGRFVENLLKVFPSIIIIG